jgi:hypothetical protein
MLRNEPVENWRELINNSDYPHDYFTTFAALISTSVSMIFPWFIV